MLQQEGRLLGWSPYFICLPFVARVLGGAGVILSRGKKPANHSCTSSCPHRTCNLISGSAMSSQQDYSTPAECHSALPQVLEVNKFGRSLPCFTRNASRRVMFVVAGCHYLNSKPEVHIVSAVEGGHSEAHLSKRKKG